MSEHHPNGRRAVPLLGSALLAVSLLAGCAGGSIEADAGAAATVASIPLPSTATAATAAAPDPTRAATGPLIRNDSSDEQVKRWEEVWKACLEEQGVPTDPHRSAQQLDSETRTRYKQEVAACQGKEPETLPVRYQREHPQQFRARLRKFITCMKNEGQKIIFIPPDAWGLTDEQAAAGDHPDHKAITKCESQAYGK
jgi:hypothetical protein